MHLATVEVRNTANKWDNPIGKLSIYQRWLAQHDSNLVKLNSLSLSLSLSLSQMNEIMWNCLCRMINGFDELQKASESEMNEVFNMIQYVWIWFPTLEQRENCTSSSKVKTLGQASLSNVKEHYQEVPEDLASR